MADKEKDNQDEKVEKPIEGTAGFEGKVGEHEVEVSADVTGSVKSPPPADPPPVANAPEDPTAECIFCGPVAKDADHWNVDCPVAQRVATRGASRDTAKSTVPAPPAAVSRAGRVD